MLLHHEVSSEYDRRLRQGMAVGARFLNYFLKSLEQAVTSTTFNMDDQDRLQVVDDQVS